MSNPARHLIAVNPGAFAALAIIFAGLFLLEGADAPSQSAFFSAALIVAFLIAVALAPSSELARAAWAHRISASGALLFLGWHFATAMPLPAALADGWAHPLAPAFHWQRPSISIAPQATLEGVVSMLGPIAAFALGALASPGRSRRDVAGRWLVLFTCALCVLSLYHHFALEADDEPRLNARMVSPNAAAAVFGVLAIFATALIVRAGKGKLGAAPRLPQGLHWAVGFVAAPLSTTALVFALACAVLTASRAGLAASALGFLVFFALVAARGARPGARSLWLAPLVGVLALSAWIFARGAGPLIDRLADNAAAAASRWELIEPHWNAFLNRPLLGNGLNSYHEINSMAATPENLQELSYAGATHNIYIQTLEETGVVGLCIMIMMLAPALLRAVRNAFVGVAATEWSAAACGVATVFLLHGIVDFELQIPAVAALFGFCLGAFVETAAPD